MEKTDTGVISIGPVETRPVATPKLTSQAIAVIAENIKLAEQLVSSVLEKDVDYGQTPGTRGMGLWDPGAAKICAAFSCYPDHDVIFHEETDQVISWMIQSKLVSHQMGKVVATGVGAASTRETKYKYRWVPDPENYGYTPAQIEDLKTKKRDGATTWRIQNPEYGELVNTLLQMAAKRSEVDAAKNLPGVGSALRKLFGGGKLESEPDWPRFWGQVKNIGLTEEAVHTILKVTSMKEWVGKGHTLDEAIITLARTAFNIVKTMQQKTKFGEERSGKQEAPPAEAPEPLKGKVPDDITEDDVAGLDSLYRLCHIFWGMQPLDVCKELGYSTTADAAAGIDNTWNAWLEIRGVKQPTEKSATEEVPWGG